MKSKQNKPPLRGRSKQESLPFMKSSKLLGLLTLVLLIIIVLLTIKVNSGNSETESLSKQNELLFAQNDSLRNELDDHTSVLAVLQEVSVIIDSIDSNRKVLKIDMLERTSATDYSSRLNDINRYVVRSEKKISDLELRLKQSNRNESIYLNMIAVLRTEINEELQEIYALEQANQQLEEKVKVQETDLKASFVELRKKEDALVKQKIQVQQIAKQLKLSEAEVFLLKG